MNDDTLIDIVNQIKIDGPRYRTVYMTDDITDSTSLLFNRQVEKIIEYDDVTERLPIRVVIDSPGGSIYPSFSILSTILRLKRLGYIVSMEGRGMIASGAFFIFICGTRGHRLLQDHSRLMVHGVQAVDIGFTNVSTSKQFASDLSDVEDRFISIVKANTDMDDDLIDKIFGNSIDYYMWPEEAIKLGVADGIL